MHSTKFVLILSGVNDDCADCREIQCLRDDEHDVSDHARVGQEEQGSQKPTSINPDAYSGRAVFLDQVSNLGNVSRRDYTSSYEPQDGKRFAIQIALNLRESLCESGEDEEGSKELLCDGPTESKFDSFA